MRPCATHILKCFLRWGAQLTHERLTEGHSNDSSHSSQREQRARRGPTEDAGWVGRHWKSAPRHLNSTCLLGELRLRHLCKLLLCQRHLVPLRAGRSQTVAMHHLPIHEMRHGQPRSATARKSAPALGVRLPIADSVSTPSKSSVDACESCGAETHVCNEDWLRAHTPAIEA